MNSSLTITLVIGLLAGLIWILFPVFCARLLIRANNFRLGFKNKHAQVDNCNWHWLESGSAEQPVIVMIHGYNGDSGNWINMAPWLKDYRLIIPDIPPFGDSTCTASYANKVDYSIPAQARRLDRFLQHLGIDKFYLAGNSMGGYITGSYTQQFESKVLGLILYSPANITAVPPLIKFRAALNKGDNPLKVETIADFEWLINSSFSHKAPYVPAPVKKMLVKRIRAIGEAEDWIFFNMINDTQSLEKILATVATPTLIFWGEADEILNPAGAVILRDQMQNAKLLMPEKTGHVPMLEYPRLAAKELTNFIETLV